MHFTKVELADGFCSCETKGLPLVLAADQENHISFKQLLAKADPNFLIDQHSFLAYLLLKGVNARFIRYLIKYGAKVDETVGGKEENSILLFFIQKVSCKPSDGASIFTGLLLGKPNLEKILIRKRKKTTLFNYILRKNLFAYNYLLGHFFLSKYLILRSVILLNEFILKDLSLIVWEYLGNVPLSEHMKRALGKLLEKLEATRESSQSIKPESLLEMAVQQNDYQQIDCYIKKCNANPASANNQGLFAIDYSKPIIVHGLPVAGSPKNLDYLTCHYYNIFNKLKFEAKHCHTVSMSPK
ncbi:MAG: hypothetical protein JSR33_01575 [Proteobacteria bacterium]|nr:hypothetical protein [Pseudomonadota bacterium]